PMVDLRRVSIELHDGDDNDVRVRLRAGDDIPGSIDAGVILAWTLVLWVEEQESYRLTAVLVGDEWTVSLLDVETGAETEFDDDPDVDGDELELEFSRDLVPRLAGPFTWAALASI